MSFFKTLQFINRHPLAKRHEARAYGNFFLWQFSQRMFPGFRKMSFVGDTCLIAKKGLEGATGNIYCGLHECEEMAFLLHFLRENDCFYDVGANIGSYTVLTAGHCNANVLSFEPIPQTFEILQRNIAINHIEKKVKALLVGVGSENGSTRFTDSLDSLNHVRSSMENELDDNFINVSVVSLDDICDSQNCPSLIKIDVEGFETEVLRGMKRILTNDILKAVIIELNGSGGRYGFDEDLVHLEFLQNGFLPFQYEPFERKLI